MGLILLSAAMITALWRLLLSQVPLEKWDSKLSTLLFGQAPLEETPGGCSMKVLLVHPQERRRQSITVLEVACSPKCSPLHKTLCNELLGFITSH